MTRFDASQAECLVYTDKEGLLSAVAHDLKIRVTKFSIEVDEEARAITATFNAASLRVVCAVYDGVDSPDTLSAANKREIEGNIVRDVLHAATHRDIRFASTSVQEKGAGYVVKGRLALHGKERPITVQVRQQGEGYVAEARVHQPDFDIRPYSALFGAIKVKADVTVRITVPAQPARA